MTAKGYTWNDQLGNYEGDPDNLVDNEIDEEESEVPIGLNRQDEKELDSSISITGHYKELLDYLLGKEDILKQLLDEKEAIEADGIIPRYMIAGTKITKSVHMISHLDQLVRDFSQEKNISQRELFEVALVEFFLKYGYKYEIETLIEQK